MPPSLTVRNLTSIPLELVLIERFKQSAAPANTPAGFLKNLTNLSLNASSTPSNLKIAEDAQSFSSLDLSIHIPAFTVRDASIPIASPTQEPQAVALRLTFVAGGQKHRMHVPAPKFESQTLHCLAPHPRFRFTGFHVRQPQGTHVAICDSAELHCWMHKLKDETPLSALSIPGTHNSPTCYKALPSVRCQIVSPREQLENGVRFFDVRVQPEGKSSNRLILVHSAFPISLTGAKYLGDLLEEVYAFLDANPSETIIMSLKREGTGSATDQQLARVLHDNYTCSSLSSKRWYVSPRVPTLGAARGKIVLFRRFHVDPDIAAASGLNAERWPDNTPHDAGATVCVQDFYEVAETTNVERKIGYATAQLRRAAACVAHVPGLAAAHKKHPPPPSPMYLNFLSASNFWKVGCWPEAIARSVNPAVLQYLVVSHAVEEDDAVGRGKVTGDGSTGIVVCDWVGSGGDWDLVRCIVAMNCKLMMREVNGTSRES